MVTVLRAVRAWAIAAWIAAVAGPAAADPARILVIEFEGGAKARPVQAAVEKILSEENVTVETSARAKGEPAAGGEGANGEGASGEGASGEGAGSGTTEGADQKEGDARLTGTLVRNRRKHFILTIKLADKRAEKQVSRLDLGRAGKLDRANASKLRRQLLASIKALPAKPPEEPAPPPKEPEPEPEPAKPEVVPPPEPPPVTPSTAREPAVVVAPLPAPAAPAAEFRNFAVVRAALPTNLITLRSYWDSREFGALEQSIGLRAPLDFSFFARTTLRSNVGSAAELTTFQIEALAWSPMLFSFGAVVAVEGAAGAGNDSVQPGVGQTMQLSKGPVRFFSMLAVSPYDSAREGGNVTGLFALTIGPIRSELYAVYGWRQLSKPLAPSAWVVRPDLRISIWRSFGIYGQYELDTSRAIGQHGVRVGAELALQR